MLVSGLHDAVESDSNAYLSLMTQGKTVPQWRHGSVPLAQFITCTLIPLVFSSCSKLSGNARMLKQAGCSKNESIF